MIQRMGLGGLGDAITALYDDPDQPNGRKGPRLPAG
jgi:hypothetical protein